MSDKPNILLDSDSTITDLVTPWFALNNATFDDDLTIEKILTWNTGLYSKGGSKIFELLKTPGLFRNLKAFPNAIEVIGRLNQHYGLYIGSAVSCDQEATEKLEWVKEHLPFIDPTHVAFTTEKSKNNLFPDVEFAALCDDAPHNVLSWNRGITLAFPYPYNRDCNPTRFVTDWLDLEQALYDLIPTPVLQA